MIGVAAVLYAGRWAVHVIAVVVLGLLIGYACTGCGAGAIQAHARAATVATVALEGIHRTAMQVTEQRLDACTDEACVASVESSMQPVAVAYEAARVTLVGWVEAIQLAQAAGDGDDVVSALFTAGSRWWELWRPLVALLSALGLEAPSLPAALAGLFGAP